jgi:phosphoglycolate phosphatase
MIESDGEVDMRAVFFDMEGTLVGFEWLLEEGEAELRAGLRELGFPPGRFDGDSYSSMWNRAIEDPASPVDETRLRSALGPVYDRYDLDAASRWTLRTGAEECLRGLREEGLSLAIVSNIGRLAMDVTLRRLGVEGAVDLVLSRDDVRLMKPDGEGLRRALDHFGLDPHEALFVGDSRTDILAARAAGVRVAIVTGGESDLEALGIDPPDHLVSSLTEIPSIAL